MGYRGSAGAGEHTSIGMLQEGNAERHKDQATNDEVGGNTVHSMQDGHQRTPLLQLKLEI